MLPSSIISSLFLFPLYSFPDGINIGCASPRESEMTPLFCIETENSCLSEEAERHESCGTQLKATPLNSLLVMIIMTVSGRDESSKVRRRIWVFQRRSGKA